MMFSYFGPLQNQNENTHIFTWKSAARSTSSAGEVPMSVCDGPDSRASPVRTSKPDVIDNMSTDTSKNIRVRNVAISIISSQKSLYNTRDTRKLAPEPERMAMQLARGVANCCRGRWELARVEHGRHNSHWQGFDVPDSLQELSMCVNTSEDDALGSLPDFLLELRLLRGGVIDER